MGLNYMSLLPPSKATFYSIVPGNSSTPIGSVTLPITFGTKQNIRTEHIKFEVADFESSYHANLGRPTLAKFMAIPHYVYLLLKMPGNIGVLSLRGDLLNSFECDKEVIVHASSIRVPRSMSEILAAAKELSLNKDSMLSKKPSQSSVKPAGDVGTKTIQLQGDDSKTAIIGVGLSDK
ncbi:uncharacterized protein LOC120688914 [Panicum virgatum]|uniref:uncharacterized protein LOC120688914 n=1 Tax=Panicum virgatum TaxID=38727 RepID=UPI0019D53984|nr:uncharacterized protein LOC120688914 [Panicum virgatum]